MRDLLESLASIVGARRLITAGDQRLRRYTEEPRGRYASECLAVALPADVGQVAAVVKCCAAAEVGMVPQGGNTGVVGGAVARADQIILNLGRLNRAPEVDPVNGSMRAQAGCILADLQAAAEAHGRFFPLSLGAEGSCQIGGNLATNAGGINVLHYGSARDLVLGLEVVLADGRIWNGLNSLRKNNTGYDLKNLFIGSEGTLGVITEATLKLFPAPRGRVVVLAGLPDPDAALALLGRLRDAGGGRLTTFELMSDTAVRFAVKHIGGQSDPLRQPHPWYALAVADSISDDPALRQRVEDCLARACEDEIVRDAVIAGSEAQARRLMALRGNIVEAQKFEGGSIKHDVSVPVAAVPELLRRARAAIEKAMPGARPCPYGHMGDGNMHLNITQPPEMDKAEFLARWGEINELVHEITHQLNGSFSAEHGIGIARLGEMKRYKDPVSLALYRRIKQALDPHDLFNSGKVNP